MSAVTGDGDKSRPKRPPKTAALILLAAVSLGFSGLLNRLEFFQTLELKTVDQRFRLLGNPAGASPDIVVVEVDDASIKNLEPSVGRWPWPRDVHAVFLDYMKTAGARLVVFDLLFLEEDLQYPEGDAQLAKSTHVAGNVVHAVFLGNQDTGAPDPELLQHHSIAADPDADYFIQADFPLPPIAAASRAIGHVANVLDADGPWRRYLLMANYRERAIPSLSLAAALALQDLDVSAIRTLGQELVAGRVRAPLDSQKRLPIWFNGGPGTYRKYGYSHIFYSQIQLQEGKEPLLEPDIFKGKIVFVGISAAGLHDLFTTPYSGDAGGAAGLGKMNGVEIHAHVLDDLMNSRYLQAVSLPRSGLLSGLLVPFVLALVLYSRLWVASTLVILLVGAYLSAVQMAFNSRLQLPVIPVLVSSGAALLLGFAYQYWIEGAEKQKVKRIFSRYVSRDVFQELLDNPAAAQLGGTRKMITVLFSDLRNFTTMSESLTPEDIITQLNEYFSAMVDIVFAYRGTVDKFVGDMVMAIFNAPLPDAAHADHALQCALAMDAKLVELNRDWNRRGRPTFRAGIGINSGEVIVGNVGSESVRNYTVIGDHVNLGARLESLSKNYSTPIVISEFTRDLLEGDYQLQELGEVVVKGKSRPVRIFGAGNQADVEEAVIQPHSMQA